MSEAMWREVRQALDRFRNGEAELEQVFEAAIAMLDHDAGPLPLAQRRLLEEVRFAFHELDSGKLRSEQRDAILQRLRDLALAQSNRNADSIT